jgi:hypothetical protein
LSSDFRFRPYNRVAPQDRAARTRLRGTLQCTKHSGDDLLGIKWFANYLRSTEQFRDVGCIRRRGKNNYRDLSSRAWRFASFRDTVRRLVAALQLEGTPLNRPGGRDIAVRNPEDMLTEYLRDPTTLLILDNCEHLIDACAHIVDVVLRCCARHARSLIGPCSASARVRRFRSIPPHSSDQTVTGLSTFRNARACSTAWAFRSGVIGVWQSRTNSRETL